MRVFFKKVDGKIEEDTHDISKHMINYTRLATKMYPKANKVGDKLVISLKNKVIIPKSSSYILQYSYIESIYESHGFYDSNCEFRTIITLAKGVEFYIDGYKNVSLLEII